MPIAILVLVGIAEFVVFARFPAALAVLARLPLLLGRVIELEPSWSEALRCVDPRSAPYRENLIVDLRPLASRIPPGRLDVVGAETTLTAGGRVAIVQVQDRIPLLWRVPFFLIARLTLTSSERTLRVGAGCYPVFAIAIVAATLSSLWTAPRPETPYWLAGLGAVWLVFSVGVLRAKVAAVVDRLASALTQPAP